MTTINRLGVNMTRERDDDDDGCGVCGADWAGLWWW